MSRDRIRGGGEYGFLPNDYLSIPSKLHEPLDSDPANRALSRSVSFLVADQALLIGVAKSMLEREGGRRRGQGRRFRDDRVCARFVAPCKSLAREPSEI